MGHWKGKVGRNMTMVVKEGIRNSITLKPLLYVSGSRLRNGGGCMCTMEMSYIMGVCDVSI